MKLSESKKFCVYEHIRPDKNAVFYVGKGTIARSRKKTGRNKYWNNIVSKNNGFIVRFVIQNIDEELAFLVESEYIDVLRRRGISLANLTNGGEGCSGRKISDESRKKISASHKGKKRSREVVERLRLSMIGRRHSDETKRKMSEFNKGKTIPIETKQKMSEAAKNKKPVICLDTGVVYESIRHAARDLGLYPQHIHKICNGVNKRTGGYRFAFAER